MTDGTTRARVLTEDERDRAVSLASEGVSIEAIAHSVGISLRTFWRIIGREPEFEADLFRALAEYEVKLVRAANAGDETADKRLARRFPQRHGADPRFRTSRDSYLDDQSESKPEASDTTTLEAIEAFLALKKAGQP